MTNTANLDIFYNYIVAVMTDNINKSETDTCEVEFEIMLDVDREDLFLTLIAEYEFSGYDVFVKSDKKTNKFTLGLDWTNFIQPADELQRFKAAMSIAKLHKKQSQISISKFPSIEPWFTFIYKFSSYISYLFF